MKGRPQRNHLNQAIEAKDLAKKLSLKFVGENVTVLAIAALGKCNENSLCFSNRESDDYPDPGVCMTFPGTIPIQGGVMESTNPRLDFARALHLINDEVGFQNSEECKVHPSAQISKSAIIGKGVGIGEGTIVGANVVLADGVQIGSHCILKSNSVIGEDGFGFERDENENPIRLPHLGGVVIEDHVEIGSLCTVCRGTIENTIIKEHVKIDDHVHVAHNVFIGEKTMITACVEISGGVSIGSNVWIGPNASIKDQLKIGSHSFVGIASNVTKDVQEHSSVAGNPARKLMQS